MKNSFIKSILFSVLMLSTSSVFPQAFAFTYQGKLSDGGNASTAQCDFTFRLYSVVSGGSQIGGDVLRDDLKVTAGVFAVNLDFTGTPLTSNAASFLEIEVRPGASTGAYTTLAPRQRLTSAFDLAPLDTDECI